MKKFKIRIFGVQHWKLCVNKAKEGGREAGGREVWENTEQRNDLNSGQTTALSQRFSLTGFSQHFILC